MWNRPLEWEGPETRRTLVSFLQGVFESSGEIVEDTRVEITQQPQFARTVFSYLKEIGANPEWVGKDPPRIAVAVEKAASIPLFNPKRRSDAYKRVMVLRRRIGPKNRTQELPSLRNDGWAFD